MSNSTGDTSGADAIALQSLWVPTWDEQVFCPFVAKSNLSREVSLIASLYLLSQARQPILVHHGWYTNAEGHFIIALYCYDWLVTLDQEGEHIWGRKWNLSTWIFAGIRYTTLLLAIIQCLNPTSNAVRCPIHILVNPLIAVYRGKHFSIRSFRDAVAVQILTVKQLRGYCEVGQHSPLGSKPCNGASVAIRHSHESGYWRSVASFYKFAHHSALQSQHICVCSRIWT